MKPTVHILVCVRKPELMQTALLIFRSIRTGFPTSPIQIWGNHLEIGYEAIIADAARQVDANFANISLTSHDAWIESLILESTGPFWIVDTDVVFWRSIEEVSGRGAHIDFIGRREPEFIEPWTDTIHVERLQTCVMFINPAATRVAIRAFMAKVPEHVRNTAQFSTIRQTFVPVKGGKTLLYDTMAGLYQAGYGTAFSEEENDCFDHLHCGSYVDLIGPALQVQGAPSLAEQHRAVLANPELLRGARHQQAKVYERLRVSGAHGVTRPTKRKEAICRTPQE